MSTDNDEYNTPVSLAVSWGRAYRISAFSLSLLVFSILTIGFFNTPPSTFGIDRPFSIEEGVGIGTIASRLESEGYIRSSNLFKFIVRSSNPHGVIAAGTYTFDEAHSTQEMVHVLMDGETKTKLTPVTFPEGWSVHDLAEYVDDVFPGVDTALFDAYEGTLFPETYFVAPHETLDQLVLRMQREYEKRVKPYREQIVASGFTEREVIIFASILEREANDEESMRRVSGVLHNRLRDDLPLQVDATFEYLLGKTSAELTVDDLTMDSPMNTYTNRGLPPQPIANPGIMAIDAVLNPRISDDYFYLTGNDGNFYYSKTFDQHKLNKERYLR